MKKRLFPILMLAGLTLVSTARSASAAPGLPTTGSVTINGQAIPATPTALPAPTATGVKNTVSNELHSNLTSAINAPVGNAIQSASSTLSNFATQQTSGITSALSNVPLVGNQINSAIQQQISSGIGNLTSMATTGFAKLLANTPLSGISSAISGILSSIGLGGGSSPNTANAQAAAQNAAIQSTIASYQTGANQAAATLARQTTPDIGSIQTGLANVNPGGNIGATLANMQGQQTVAGIALNSNPTSGSLIELEAIGASANQVVAQSANGVAGQAELQSRVSTASLNAAGMQAQGTQTFDNSLDQLNAISQQLGQQGAINAESVRIAAEQRTLTAAQLAQSSNDATARTRKEQAEAEQNQRTQDSILNGQAAIAGMIGVQAPTPATASPTTPTTPATPAAASVLVVL